MNTAQRIFENHNMFHLLSLHTESMYYQKSGFGTSVCGLLAKKRQLLAQAAAPCEHGFLLRKRLLRFCKISRMPEGLGLDGRLFLENFLGGEQHCSPWEKLAAPLLPRGGRELLLICGCRNGNGLDCAYKIFRKTRVCTASL